VDTRADLYSLGAVAYFALLGRPPFEGVTPETILARQTADQLPPLHQSRADVPRELEEVLRTAVTGDPAGRYPGAQAFRKAVRRSRGFLRRLLASLREA
jgi:serine/threonine-protein kinase